jgi:CheY-like chemotaxis protein
MVKKSGTIMVADDDPAIVDALQLLLEDEGYTVMATVDGETVPHMDKSYPDLLLLDIWMSGINGGDICKQLKQQVRTRNIPIILISANRDTEAIARASGADDFLLKPFDIDDLLRKIDKFVHSSGTQGSQNGSSGSGLN